MRTTLLTAVCAGFVLFSCTPAAPPSVPTVPASAPSAVQSPAATPVAPLVTEPSAAPSDTVAATSEPAAPNAPPSIPDLVDSPGDSRLESAAALLKAGQHTEARRELERVLPDIDKSGKLDAKMAAHALLGRVCSKMGDTKCVAEQFSLVRAAWKDPIAAAKKLDAAGGSDVAKLERLQRAVNAAGEAVLQVAEEKRRAAEKEVFPAYAGTPDRASIKKHIATKVAAWVKARRALIEEADKSYSEIAHIQPFPPARWVVASRARVGQMWGRFVAEYRAAPIPKDWRGTGPLPGMNVNAEDVRAGYYAALDEASAPERARAVAAFKTCQSMSQKLGVQDDYSKSCDTWLAKNNVPAASP